MNVNVNLNTIANFLESCAGYIATVLAIIAAAQHGGNPLGGTVGHIAGAAALSTYGLHHGQTNK